MENGPWIRVVAGATIVVAGACLLLATVLFIRGVFLNVPYHGTPPPWVDAATDLVMFAAFSYLLASGAVLIGLWRRSPIPYLVAALVLSLAVGLVAGPEIDAWRQTEIPFVWIRTNLPGWTVPVGIGSVLLALAIAWGRRPDRRGGLGTFVAALAAAAIFVAVSRQSATTMATAITAAPEEASEAVCAHAAAPLVFRIQSKLTVPNLRMRGARDLSFRFVIADVQGTGYEGDEDIGVWLIGEPNRVTYDPVPPIYAVNPIAAAVSDFPHTPMDGQWANQVDACIREVQREVSGM